MAFEVVEKQSAFEPVETPPVLTGTEVKDEEVPEPYYLSSPRQRREWQARGPMGWWEYAALTWGSDIYYGEVMGAGSLYGLVDRLQTDEYKTKKDRGRDMEDLYGIMMKREEMQERGMSWGANIYKIVAQIPSFAMEMYLTGGLATSMRKGFTKGAQKAGLGFLKKRAVGKAAEVLGREAVVGLARTSVMPHRYFANYAERQVNDVLAITDKGIELLDKGNQEPVKTFMKAYGDAFVEYYSETLGGELLRPAAKVAGRGIFARMPKALQQNFVKLAETLKKAVPEGRWMEFITRGGYDGILEEYGEERLASLFRIPMGLDERDIPTLDKLQEAVFPGWEQSLIEIGAFSIWGGGSASGQMIANRLRRKGRSEEDIRKVLNNLSQKEKDAFALELGKDFDERVERAETIIKAAAGAELTAHEKKTLETVHQEFVEKGLVEAEEEQKPQEKAQAVVQANAKQLARPKVTPKAIKPEVSGEILLEKQISELGDRLTQVEVAQDALEEIEFKRKELKGRIKKGTTEEMAELPKYYVTRKKEGLSWDEAAEELRDLGIEINNERDLIDYLKNLDYSQRRMKAFIAANKPKLISKRESTILKERIRDIDRGIKAGKYAQRKETKAVQDELINILKQSNLDAKDYKKFIKAIEKTQTAEQLAKILPQIDARISRLTESAAKRKLVTKIVKRPKRPENIVDIKYQKQIDSILDKLGERKGERVKKLKTMSANQLAKLADLIASLEKEGKELFKSKKAQREMATEILRGALIKAAGGMPEMGALTKGSKEEQKLKRRNILTQAQLNVLSPLNLVRSVFGEVGERLFYDSIDKADTIKVAKMNERKKRVEASAKKHKVKILNLADTVNIDNKTFSINAILRMYLAKKDPQSWDALLYGNNISEAEVDSFIAQVPKKYIKFADDVQKIVGEKYQEIADVMAEYYNVQVEKVPVYFPIRRKLMGKAPEEMNDSLETELIQEQVIRKGAGFKYTTIDKGNTITREDIDKEFQREISLDFLGDALRIIDKQEHLIAFAPLQKAFNKAINDFALQEAVRYNYGESTWNHLNDYLLTAVNPDYMWHNIDSVTRFFNYMLRGTRRGLAKAYLSYNAVTAAKQFPSSSLALKYTSPVQLEQSIQNVILSNKYREAIYELDPSLRNRIVSRDFNELMVEIEKIPDGALKKQLKRLSQTVDKKAFWMIMSMDKLAVLGVYDAVYRHQRKTKSEAEARDKAHKAVIETQPQGAVKDLPALYRTNNEIIRMMIMFTNQLNKIWNMMTADMPREVVRGEYGKAATGLASIMISSTMIYLASHGRLPEDLDDFFDAIFGSAVASIPIVGNLAMSAIRGYTPSISPADSISKKLKMMYSDLRDGEYLNALDETYFLLSIWLGLPYSQTKRTLQGIRDLATGQTSDFRRLIWSEYMLENN